jgi:TonB-linked SusC/RagA family outer membrane protein
MSFLWGKRVFAATVLLSAGSLGSPVFSSNMNAENSLSRNHYLKVKSQTDIQGKVLDQYGSPIPGATVKVKNTDKGTTTAADGAFSLNGVTLDDTIVVSFIGYKTVEVKAAQTLNITLLSEGDLEEVVVVGYGTQKKATVTGSIAEVKGEDLVKAPVANLTNALAGRLPGLTATQPSGQPGADGSRFNIRGFGTALVLIDGVPGSFANIDASEIENVTVLKDASANIYGFSAANGAILVTTKKGTAGKTSISYNGFYGIQQNTTYPKMLDAGQYTELYDEAVLNDQLANNRPLVPTFGKDVVQKWRDQNTPEYTTTDWQDLAIRDIAPMTQHNINVNGGAEKVRYFMSGSYLDQKSIWESDATTFKRYNLRSNIIADITDRLTAEVNIGGIVTDLHTPVSATSNLIINGIRRSLPTSKAYANDNRNYYGINSIGANVLAEMDDKYSGYIDDLKKELTTTASLNYKIPGVEGLSAKAFYSYKFFNNDLTNYRKRYELYSYNATTDSYNPTVLQNPTALTKSNTNEIQTVLQTSLNYSNSFGKHNIRALALFERRYFNEDYLYGYRQFALENLEQLNLGNIANQSLNGFAAYEAREGYVGRLNYDYDNKYLLEFSGRYDGSYKLPPNTRFAFFPAVSAGWVVSREDWFKVSPVNNLKLRASWGESPDDEPLSGGQYYLGYNFGNSSYVFNPGSVTSSLNPAVQPNYILTYSKSRITNLGFDASLWDNMLTVNFDAFLRKRSGLPATRASVTIPSTAGIALPQENLNSDQIRGFEIALAYNKTINDLSFSIAPNITYKQAKNLHIEQSPYNSAWSNFLGNTINRNKNILFGYEYLGQFQSMEEIAESPIQDNNANKSLLPGDLKYADLNNDGVINNQDRKVIGRGLEPDVFYGLNLYATYKGFDATIFFQGASNYSTYFGNEIQRPFFNGGNTYDYFTDRWTREDIYDPNSSWIPGKFPSTRLNGTDNNSLISSFWVTNAYYLRVKNVDIGYSFNSELLSKANIKGLRLYANASNLFTITNVNYIDPEVTDESLQGRYYPQQRVISFGVQAKF